MFPLDPLDGSEDYFGVLHVELAVVVEVVHPPITIAVDEDGLALPEQVGGA